MVDKSKLTPTDLKCVWSMGSGCADKVYDVAIFNNQIKIPICESHLEDHEHVMTLHRNGYDIEEIIQKDENYRKEEVLVIRLSGLDKDNKDGEGIL
jgi:hypothetical protein